MKKKIGYLLFYFPIRNMTYILNEVTDLIDLEQDVELLSFDKPPHATPHKDFSRYRLGEKVRYKPLERRPDGTPLTTRDLIAMAGKSFFGRGNMSFSQKVNLLRACYDRQVGKSLSLARFYACMEAIRFIRELDIDVLYIHLGNNASYFLPITQVVSIPIATFFHGMDFTAFVKSGGEYSELFEKGSLFFVGSKYAKDALIELGCPSHKLHILGIGVDSSKINYTKRTLSDKVNVLSVGRFSEKKGFEYSIRAIAQVRETHNNITYNIIGDGTLRPRLEQLVRELQLDDTVNFLGFLAHDQVIDTMQRNDIFLAPSVTAQSGDTESLGVVLLEAQLTGMPVLATSHNGFPEAIDVNRSGFLVPERDIQSLAEKLTHLIDNPEKWEAMGRNGRDYVVARYEQREIRTALIEKLNNIA
jgi:colanic acid/amylovoran biosynthesis glycosyltransferase